MKLTYEDDARPENLRITVTSKKSEIGTCCTISKTLPNARTGNSALRVLDNGQ